MIHHKAGVRSASASVQSSLVRKTLQAIAGSGCGGHIRGACAAIRQLA